MLHFIPPFDFTKDEFYSQVFSFELCLQKERQLVTPAKIWGILLGFFVRLGFLISKISAISRNYI